MVPVGLEILGYLGDQEVPVVLVVQAVVPAVLGARAEDRVDQVDRGEIRAALMDRVEIQGVLGVLEDLVVRGDRVDLVTPVGIQMTPMPHIIKTPCREKHSRGVL